MSIAALHFAVAPLSQPLFISAGHRLFTVYTDARGVTDNVFCAEADFELTDVSL